MKKSLIGTLIMCLPIYSIADVDQEIRTASKNAPKFKNAYVVIESVNTVQPLQFEGHKKVMNMLLRGKYMNNLYYAMYVQDIFHAFDSKAHFDNCDFDGALTYIENFISEIDSRHNVAKAYENDGKIFKVKAEAEYAFFNMGQALHAIQDFYAHTNYIDEQIKFHERYQDIEVIPVWAPESREIIHNLIKGGLVSGVVGYSLDKKCSDTAPTHGELSKDSPSKGNGAVRLTSQPEVSKYDVTVYLAREASKDFFEFAFSRWPIFANANGNSVAYRVLLDGRDELSMPRQSKIQPN
jgi:hypothetical protein